MSGEELLAKLCEDTKTLLELHLQKQPVAVVASVDAMEALLRQWLAGLGHAMLASWTATIEAIAQRLGGHCPKCGAQRHCKRRATTPMRVDLLGFSVKLPKLYLECGHCDAPGVSITRLLTGIGDGAASGELELMAAYCGAEHSYGKASRDLAVHHGAVVERTAVRRMALEVEATAVAWAEQERQKALARVAGEARTEGTAQLMLQGDGGTVRTGRLAPCQRGDAGYRHKSPKRGLPKRKRVTEKREVITLDVRVPGVMESSALDVLVPILALPAERERRMLALAARAGLGDNTQMLGLGDLGSGLPQAFDEAFVGYNAFYSADWQHVRKYVQEAAAVLTFTDQDASRWERQLRDAIWKRDERKRDKLLKKARSHRVEELPTYLERCPLAALQTYLTNNWRYLQSAQLKQLAVDFVSARAEAQVRDRTKARFVVPGAWRVENLEPKATLRAIIAEGRWDAFRSAYLEQRRSSHATLLEARLTTAVAEGRLDAAAIAKFHSTALPTKEFQAAA
jgi:hypothetical protein